MILLQAAALMETANGGILYLVSTTAENPDGIYVVEVWDTQADHDASLALPGVLELITQAMPLLDGPPDGITLDVGTWLRNVRPTDPAQNIRLSVLG